MEHTMSKPKIGIIICTTREGRFGDKPAQWIFELAKAHGGADFEAVDLRDFPLPLFNELKSPAWESPKNEVAQRWGRKVAELDGYVFVTGEYNHGVPGVLKNALDHTYKGFNRKLAAFVGYGGVGAARAVEHLRLILVELQVAPLRNAVHIGMAEFMGLLQQGKTFADYPYLAQSGAQMLGDLIWWTTTLKAGRHASA
jgi:NAD(P)H-dependent FMN reductase